MWPRAATPPEPFRLSGLTPLQGVSRSRFSSPIPAISQRPAARDSGSVKNGTNLQIRCTPGTADLSKSAKNVLSAVPYRLSLLQSGEQVRQPLNIIALFGRLPDHGARNPEEIASFLPGCRTSPLKNRATAGRGAGRPFEPGAASAPYAWRRVSMRRSMRRISPGIGMCWGQRDTHWAQPMQRSAWAALCTALS